MTQILVADDDSTLRDALQALLIDAGHEVVIASDGLEVVAEALAVAPQVIVTDVHMPVMEGPEAIGILRALRRFSLTPVIFMSGATDEAPIAPGERLWRKPVNPSLLVDTVTRLAVESREKSEQERPITPPAASRNPGALPRSELEAGQVVRFLALVGEQKDRIDILRRQGADTRLAVELLHLLIQSFITLADYQRRIKATRDSHL